MEQALTSDARPIPEHVVDGFVRFDHAGLLTEEDRREMIRRIQLDLLRARRERPRNRRAAEQRDELAPSHSITSLARRVFSYSPDLLGPWSMSAFGATAGMGRPIVPIISAAFDPSLTFGDQSCCDAQRVCIR